MFAFSFVFVPFGGRLASLDIAPALEVRGILLVVKPDKAYIVLADGYWAAKRGPDWRGARAFAARRGLHSRWLST